MAKVPVILIVDQFHPRGEEDGREVASFSYSFNQTIDKEGQVADIPRGGIITVKLKVINKGNTDMLSWMTDKMLALDGKIIFYDTSSGQKMKTIEFTGAYCVNYEEHWEDSMFNVPLAHWEEITLSCWQIKCEKVNFKQLWKPFMSKYQAEGEEEKSWH